MRSGKIKREKEAILRDYPDFVDRLLLLLNAGLVLSTALHRLAEEGAPRPDKSRPAPLYRELYRIHVRVRESNTSFVEEFNFETRLLPISSVVLIDLPFASV